MAPVRPSERTVVAAAAFPRTSASRARASSQTRSCTRARSSPYRGQRRILPSSSCRISTRTTTRASAESGAPARSTARRSRRDWCATPLARVLTWWFCRCMSASKLVACASRSSMRIIVVSSHHFRASIRTRALSQSYVVAHRFISPALLSSFAFSRCRCVRVRNSAFRPGSWRQLLFPQPTAAGTAARRRSTIGRAARRSARPRPRRRRRPRRDCASPTDRAGPRTRVCARWRHALPPGDARAFSTGRGARSRADVEPRNVARALAVHAAGVRPLQLSFCGVQELLDALAAAVGPHRLSRHHLLQPALSLSAAVRVGRAHARRGGRVPGARGKGRRVQPCRAQ